VWAATVVLTAFMLGIAIGAMLAARWTPRHAGRAFAAAELVVGTTGILLVWTLPAFEAAIAQWLAPLAAQGATLAGARLLLALALLLVPTIAMGTTLPFGVRMLADRDTTRALGVLYGANTFGACVAPLVAEFLLIEPLGLRGTALAGAALNVLAASLGLLHPVPDITTRPAEVAREAVPAPWRLLAAAAGAGALALALEVIWFRLLLLHAPGNRRKLCVDADAAPCRRCARRHCGTLRRPLATRMDHRRYQPGSGARLLDGLSGSGYRGRAALRDCR
jgi:MFS family permease